MFASLSVRRYACNSGCNTREIQVRVCNSCRHRMASGEEWPLHEPAVLLQPADCSIDSTQTQTHWRTGDATGRLTGGSVRFGSVRCSLPLDPLNLHFSQAIGLEQTPALKSVQFTSSSTTAVRVLYSTVPVQQYSLDFIPLELSNSSVGTSEPLRALLFHSRAMILCALSSSSIQYFCNTALKRIGNFPK